MFIQNVFTHIERTAVINAVHTVLTKHVTDLMEDVCFVVKLAEPATELNYFLKNILMNLISFIM